MGRLYLHGTSANGERKRAACSCEFRIKEGCTLQNLERKTPQWYAPEDCLTLFEQSCRAPLSLLWTLAFHKVIFCTSCSIKPFIHSTVTQEQPEQVPSRRTPPWNPWVFITSESICGQISLFCHQSWRYLKDLQIWCLGTWISGEFGSVNLMAKLGDIMGLFQLKLLYDSMTCPTPRYRIEIHL